MKNLKIIGITGTNGKTTTAFLIYHLLKKMGQKSSLIGTIKYIIGRRVFEANLTTPGSTELGKLLKKSENAGSQFVVMEVSSHALAQERVKGLKFSHCIFTNLSRDHLDYHKTIDNYFNTKKKLFFSQEAPFSLINIDDQYGRKIFKEVKRGLSFAITAQADFKAENIILGKRNTCFDLIFSGKSYPIKTRLCGRYNVLNVLGAVSLVSSLGFSLLKVAKAVSAFKPVEGRLELVSSDIFIDYAHTPDALDNVLKTLREVGYEKIVCLFGCGGDRDEGKRKLMGQIACCRADFTFITSDNPRSEEPGKICSQIEKGFKKNNYLIIGDRRKAIRAAIKVFLKNKARNPAYAKAPAGKSCLLIAGKGHEKYQIINDKRIPFNDKLAVKEFLGRQK